MVSQFIEFTFKRRLFIKSSISGQPIQLTDQMNSNEMCEFKLFTLGIFTPIVFSEYPHRTLKKSYYSIVHLTNSPNPLKKIHRLATRENNNEIWPEIW